MGRKKSSFPKELLQEAQYRNNKKSLGVYLQNYHMIPYGRTIEILYDLTGHRISAGSLANFQKDIYSRLDSFEEKLKQLLLQLPVLK